MSVMLCTDCGAYVDTDDGTGLFDPRPGKTGFWCESCVEAAIDEAVTSRWTVRGVSPAVSDLAVLEAGRRGLTVGDWLTLAIVRSSTKFKK